MENIANPPDETFLHLFLNCPTVQAWHGEFVRRYLNDINLNPGDSTKLWFLGITPGTDSPSFAVLSVILLFQYCIWEEKLRKRKPAFRTINLLFEEILSASFSKNKIFNESAATLPYAIFRPFRVHYGPCNKNATHAHSVRSHAKPAPVKYTDIRYLKFTKEKLTSAKKYKYNQIILLIFLFFQHTRLMEPGSVPCLTDEEAMRLGEGAAAAVTAAEVTAAAAAAAAAAALISDKITGNSSLPASSGFVQTANPPFPPSERSKLIRINRELNSKPTVLGGGGCLSALGEMENFHSIGDGRLKRSVLVENMSDFTIATASFTPATWCCVSCSVKHTLLPKKRNVNQWEGGRKVIVLSDQAMPAVLPSSESRCPAIIRIEGGSLNELGKNFCSILGDFALPPVSVMIHCSLSNLRIEGLATYIERSINEVRRFSSMFKNTISCIPIAPPPLCGIPDADTVRSLYDYTLWLDSLPDYGLLGYNSVLRQILVNTKTESVSHVPGRLLLHTGLHSFEKKLFERQGWEGLPGSVPPCLVKMRKLSSPPS